MKISQNAKAPFGKGRFSKVKNVRYLSWEDAFDVEFEDGLAFSNRTPRFARRTRLLRKQDSTIWKLTIGVRRAFTFTTTTDRLPKCRGRSSANCRRKNKSGFMGKRLPICGFAVLVFVLVCSGISVAETIRVATYNVENYLDQPTESRPHAKSAEAKAKIRESIESPKPDVLAIEEMGTTNALLDLRASLKAEGWIFRFGNISAARIRTSHRRF